MTEAARFEHALLEQVSAYEAMREELEWEYPGRWVIISGSRLMGDYSSFHEADETATQSSPIIRKRGDQVIASWLRGKVRLVASGNNKQDHRNYHANEDEPLI